jgi:plasmid stabilization system protein ParE
MTLPDQSDARPVLVSPAERKRLEAIAGALERKNFKADAQLVRELAARFDGSKGLILVQESALTRAAAERAPRRRSRARSNP